MEPTSEPTLAADATVAPDAYTLPDPPPLPKKRNSFFFGRFGLRAGWGIAIFILLFAIITVIASLFAVGATGHAREIMAARAQAQAHPGGPKPGIHMDFVPILVIVQDGITFFCLFGVCWLFSRGERRPLASYGIGRNRRADILPGAFWGLIMLSLVVFVLHTAHLLVFDGQNLRGISIVLYGLKWLLAFTLVGFSEEYTFRGYVQFTLMRGVWGLAERISATNTRAVAFWIAGTLLSLGFAGAHTGNGGENFFGLVQVFLAGMVFTYALWRTGSLWWGIGFHATWDWAQSFLFGVADSGNISVGRLFVTHPQGKPILSGGADGPEGSIFASVALLLTIVVIHLVSRGAQPAVEQQPEIASPLPSISPGY
jgi:membrane protease YdiL (CAAX protease family)